MADKKLEITEEDKSHISQILEPLNVNPSTSEALSPMAKVLRGKLGHAEPISFSEETKPEHESGTPSDDVEDFDFSGGDDDDFNSPPESNISDDDDIDLDELLREPSAEEIQQSKEPDISNIEIPVNESDIPSDDFGLSAPENSLPENLSQDTPDDPFADLLDSPSDSVSTDSFDALDDTPIQEKEEDPFSDMGDASMANLGDDPFSGLDDPVETTEEDPFSNLNALPEDEFSSGAETDFGGDSTDNSNTPSLDSFSDMDSTTSTEEENPFAGLGESTSSTDSMFNEIGGDSDPISSESNEDIFPGFDASPPDFSSDTPTDTSSDDVFGDIGDISTDSKEESSGPSMNFDDFDSDLGTSSIENISGSSEDSFFDDSDISDSGGEEPGSIDDDLSSLADEETSYEENLSDEDLASIQQEIIKYPPKLKRTVIDAFVNDRISKQNQKDLIELIKANQKPEDITSFLSPLLGYKVELFDSSGQYSADGIPIIATKPIYTKEGLLRQKQLIKKSILGVAASLFFVFGFFSAYKHLYKPWQAGGQYELGLLEIRKANEEKDPEKRKIRFAYAEEFFSKGEKIEPNSLKYLNLYGIHYMKAGEYERAFEKLFGKVSPDFGTESSDPNNRRAWNKRTEVPNITLAKNESWNNLKLPIAGRVINENDTMKLIAQDKVERKILKAGAYIVSRLEKDIHDTATYINLGRFHSNTANSFTDRNRYKGVDYKNDELAINYYKEVFTDSNDPYNVPAITGIAKIYYNKNEFSKAASYYNKIIEAYPKNEIGHGGLLSTYIEMWKRDKNPQFVLNHHRQVRNALGIEEDLSMFVLAKLAAFYNDLDSKEVRIRYNINPEDQVTGMEIDDNVEHLLAILFSKKEDRDGEEIKGGEYAEGYYQRGRFHLKKGETRRALKQFEFAANYDPAHYLAVLQMAEYYMRVNDMSEASKLLTNSKERYETYKIDYGVREEDEVLIEGDPGRIYFDMGKIIYLASVGVTKKDNIVEFPGRKIYPERSLGKLTQEDENRRKELHESLIFFNKANDLNLKNEMLKREMYFYKGWIEYMHSNWTEALNIWSNIGEEDAYSNPTLLIGKANAFYYTGQLNASLGNYLKVKEDFEDKEAAITTPVPEDMNHQEIYQTLVAIYNNIGAVYERKNNTTEALKSYWKSIEKARKLSITNEIANSNKDLVFKVRPKGNEPLLDDWLAPTLDTIRELKNVHSNALQ
ncbi:MAG: hypothetical protein HS129_12550 [Leptospiraceae bacterium]|nr:hypothetical protein [Leptospiraceae bacterium]